LGFPLLRPRIRCSILAGGFGLFIQLYLEETFDTVTRLKTFLNESTLQPIHGSIPQWHGFLAQVKSILGNFNNRISFVALLMAKAYLVRKLALAPFDATSKAQGAPGLDIEERTLKGERVIGEIKTTEPYLMHDFGAQQLSMFKKDFDKLNAESAAYKFFFVSDSRSFELMKRKYAKRIPGVTFVSLLTNEECIATASSAASM